LPFITGTNITIMKKLFNNNFSLILVFSIILFSACKSNSKTETRDIQLLTDSSAYNNNTFSDTSRLEESEPVPASLSENEARTRTRSTSTKARTTSSGTSTTAKSSGTVSNSGSANTSTPTTTEKKGWSKAAQGAVIGGAAGAVGGAIISKKKGTGAAVGAAVGAAGGYIIGRQKDKKDGRVK